MKIIHIIVQNNKHHSARSRWTKQQQQDPMTITFQDLLNIKCIDRKSIIKCFNQIISENKPYNLRPSSNPGSGSN